MPPSVIPEEEKVEMFVAIRQSFGRSALLLSGGGGLGLHHFGVLKALYDADLLPRIVSGSSAGSLIGALICTVPEDKIGPLLRGELPEFTSSPLIARPGEDWKNKVDHFLR